MAGFDVYNQRLLALPAVDTSAIAAELFRSCVSGGSWPPDLLERLLEAATSRDAAIAEAASRSLFAGLVEPLSDRFEPALCETYARLFCQVIAGILPEFRADELESRYQRLRRPRRFADSTRQPQRVFVLSRVTLGADVAVTSIILDAAKKRFPDAEIFLVGGLKSWELFAADPRLRPIPVEYTRGGTLAARLEAGLSLREELARAGSLVIDPDSRLTQLGLLPVSPEDSYFFFESRSYGGIGAESLSQLTKRWVAETFGIVDALPYIAPALPSSLARPRGVAVSFGVGDNPSKQVSDPFEEELLRGLVKKKLPVLVDKGGGGEEARRVERAIERSGARPGQIETWDGAFAPFAARIARSRLYVGYDSAGQHVAAACKTPLVSVFAGYPSDRFLARWRPSGSGRVAVLPAADNEPHAVLARTLSAVETLLAQ